MAQYSVTDDVGSGYWDGALEVVDVCPACGQDKSVLGYSDLNDSMEKLPGQWSMRRCLNCRSLFLTPRPKSDAVGKAYRTYYTHEVSTENRVSGDGRSLVWRLINGYLNSRYGSRRNPSSILGAFMIPFLFPVRQQLDFFMRHLSKSPGRLLDIGCGNGQFLLRAAAAGWDAFGLEPDPLAVRAAQQSGANVVQGLVDTFVAGSPFDVITVSHVIEHVHNPQVFVHKTFERLNAGGVVWLATPNVNSLGHWWFGPAWRGLEPPRHITVFSAKALTLMLERAGFVDIKFHRRGRGSGYILRASAEIARQLGGAKKLRLSPILVDILSSLFILAAEELVVTAKRPAQ